MKIPPNGIACVVCFAVAPPNLVYVVIVIFNSVPKAHISGANLDLLLFRLRLNLTAKMDPLTILFEKGSFPVVTPAAPAFNVPRLVVVDASTALARLALPIFVLTDMLILGSKVLRPTLAQPMDGNIAVGAVALENLVVLGRIGSLAD